MQISLNCIKNVEKVDIWVKSMTDKMWKEHENDLLCPWLLKKQSKSSIHWID